MPGIPRACDSANRASGPPAIAMATPGVDGRRLRNGGNSIKRATPLPDARRDGAFERRDDEGEEEKGRESGPKLRSLRAKGVALSICPLNHPLSAATPGCRFPWARSDRFVPSFLRFSIGDDDE